MCVIAAGYLYYMRIIWLINGLCIQHNPPTRSHKTSRADRRTVVQLKYKIVSCIPDSQTSAGNRKVVAIAGHVRQEIVGTLYYANYTSISHHLTLRDNLPKYHL